MAAYRLAPGIAASFTQYILAPLIGEASLDWIAAIVTFPASLLSNCHVVSLQHRKDVQMPEHEYLLATIYVKTSTDKVHTRYVRVERRSGGAGGFRLLGRQGTLAKDSISISPDPFITYGSCSLYDLEFSEGNRPNILDLAAILEAINSIDADYHLSSSNCYWFARMVFEGMAYAFSGQVTNGEKPHRRGRFARVFPVLNEEGVPTLGMSSSMKLWKKHISAFPHAEVPGISNDVLWRQKLVEGIFARCRDRLHAGASRAEELARVNDDDRKGNSQHRSFHDSLCLIVLSLMHFILRCLGSIY